MRIKYTDYFYCLQENISSCPSSISLVFEYIVQHIVATCRAFIVNIL